ncbi:MAG: cobalamin-dependent protein, partial [Candidatus Wallbacteria bacterium]|nr:cobalamin-dependent protein [Candidatus Wallbacteria bacterium]
VLDEILMPAMQSAGELYERGRFYLPQLLAAAEVMQGCAELLEQRCPGTGTESKKKVLLASVEGDVHDIGKGIVSMLLRTYGISVKDLGRDVKSSAIVEAVMKDNDIAVVGLSALMTTTMIQMKKVIDDLNVNGCRDRVLVVVGGAVVTAGYASEIGADFYAGDAETGVRYIREKVK